MMCYFDLCFYLCDWVIWYGGLCGMDVVMCVEWVGCVVVVWLIWIV